MLQATFGQTKLASKNYCVRADVGGPAATKGPFNFSFGGCLTEEKNFDIQKGEDAKKELERKYAAGDICWYAYQYEDESGSSAGSAGPSKACLAKYKDNPDFQKTITGVNRAFLDYVDRIKIDPINAQIPDIRKYLDIPEGWVSTKKTTRWRRWALVGVVAVAALVVGGVVIYSRKRRTSSKSAMVTV